MQWSQIKTIFILCFLILDIYLLIQFVDKRNEADIDVISQPESSFDDRLKNENITVGDIQVNTTEASHISVSQKLFTEDELSQLDTYEDQTAEIVSNNMIASYFEEPIPLAENASVADISELVEQHILYPDDFRYWGWNSDLNVIVFVQEKDDRPIYFNEYALLLLFLTEDYELSFYTQAMLGDTEPQGGMKTLTKPIQAIESLFNRNELVEDDEVTRMEIGYHTRIPLEDGVQIFAPTYRVMVNDDRNYFVNAIEGHVLPIKDREFLLETIDSTIEKIRRLDEDNEVRTEVLPHLYQIQEESNWSDTE
ncbi:two-component system regulatory protein YycI [Virgibacillus sp. C22-A2]|uniref:Two-component system regulatory protein YycI n=1 Tax=Virgibacillus tibetensis TaxID=3042313 RepID=A0ABU6KIY0_9BACI|nr:two-component system regulatory protein YycI [Virgibacillus sp. C22-A2]